MMDKGRVILLFSGGIDSTARLVDLAKQKRPVTALLVNYGQMHFDLQFYVCDKLINMIRTQFSATISWRLEQAQFPMIYRRDELLGRNAYLLNIAMGQAHRAKARTIATGFVDGPESFPDQRFAETFAYVSALNLMYGHRAHTRVDLLNGMNRMQSATLLVKEGLFEMTCSCDYAPDIKGCGVCASCRQRRELFEQVKKSPIA